MNLFPRDDMNGIHADSPAWGWRTLIDWAIGVAIVGLATLGFSLIALASEKPDHHLVLQLVGIVLGACALVQYPFSIGFANQRIQRARQDQLRHR